MAGRKTLPHECPLWVDASREIFFVTACCKARSLNQLAKPEIADALLSSVMHRNDAGIWWAHLFLIMPDHCHALLSFPPDNKGLPDVVSDWKRWTATRLNVARQRDFFDHRLRHGESAWEKAEYILDNPVRAGLVLNREEWPYVWMPSQDTLRIAR